MNLIKKMDSALSENILTQLTDDETKIKSGLATIQLDYKRMINVNLLLTNKRFIIEQNKKTVVIETVAGSIGGMSGGDIAGAAGGAAGATLFNSSTGLPCVFNLSDISEVLPFKFKLLSFIPGRNIGINIKLNSSKEIKLLTNNRDEWIESILSIIKQSSI